MTERVLPLADGASACPFVAFADDRDERASVPDPRHRCYAEPHPAPRALAHQEAYCLSSAFPVCPIFQDWARREAARARDEAASSAALAADSAAAVAGASAAPLSSEATANPLPGDAAGNAVDRLDRDSPADELAGRNPPRDWSAPPPWLASRDAPRSGDEPRPFLGRRGSEPGQGLSGSPADRFAGGPTPTDEGDDDEPWTASGASAAAGRAALGGEAAGRRAGHPDHDDDPDGGDEEMMRVTRRPRAYDQHLGGTAGPDWERPRRQEAYPTIKTRVGLPNVPRLAALAGLVGLVAVALFFLPAILGLGTSNGTPGTATPSPSSGSSAGPTRPPTQAPAPTPSIYTIKKGDTLSKIAAANGITIEELLAANPTIKNPNRVTEGQQITLPVASQPPPNEIGGSAEPSIP